MFLKCQTTYHWCVPTDLSAARIHCSDLFISLFLDHTNKYSWGIPERCLEITLVVLEGTCAGVWTRASCTNSTLWIISQATALLIDAIIVLPKRSTLEVNFTSSIPYRGGIMRLISGFPELDNKLMHEQIRYFQSEASSCRTEVRRKDVTPSVQPHRAWKQVASRNQELTPLQKMRFLRNPFVSLHGRT